MDIAIVLSLIFSGLIILYSATGHKINRFFVVLLIGNIVLILILLFQCIIFSTDSSQDFLLKLGCIFISGVTCFSSVLALSNNDE